MVKRVSLLLLVICTSISLLSCGYTQEELEEIDRIEENAEENAIKYIQNKYGFNAEIVETEYNRYNSGPVPDFSARLTGRATVKMKYNNKEFIVNSSGNKGSTECFDNYQQEEIKDTIKNELESINDIEIEEIIMVLHDTKYKEDYTEDNLISDYFNGNNIEDILKNNKTKIIANCIGTNLSSIQYYNCYIADNTDLAFVSYKNKEAFNIVGDKRKLNIGGIPIDSSITDHSLYIDSYKIISYGELVEDTDFIAKKHDDFYYVIKDGEYANIEESTIDSDENWNGHGFITANKIYKSYSIDTNADYISIFIPLSNLQSGYKDELPSIVTQYKYKDNEHKDYKSEITDLDTSKKCIKACIYNNSKIKDLKFTVMEDLGD